MFKWYKLNFCRKISIWHRWNKKANKYEFNHIKDQWSNKSKPVGHPSWKSGIWLNFPGWLDYKNRVHIGRPLVLINSVWDNLFLASWFIIIGILCIIWILELLNV